MPLFYKHWSFGKDFARNEALYRKGWQGLAYEIVINSDPCICYIMEENSATMQTLVLAHAAMGPQSLFQEQLRVPTMDGCFRHCRLPVIRQGLHRQVRGAIWHRGGREAGRCGACASEPWNSSLPRQALDGSRHGRASRAGKAQPWRGAVQRSLAHRAEGQGQEAREQAENGRGSPQGNPETAGREHPLLPGENCAASGRMAAGDPAHHPPHRAVLLSAAPDQDDE